MGSVGAHHSSGLARALAVEMKLYIAGGSYERLTVVQPIVDRLIGAGVEITYDWTRDPGWNAPVTPEVLAAAARRDMRGIVEADVVWLVVPADKSEGSAGELGIALALGKVCIVSGECSARNIWTTMCAVGFSSHALALEWVLEMYQQIGQKHG